MKLFFSFIAGCCFGLLPAQTNIDSLLVGSWQLTAYGMGNEKAAPASYSETISFYSDGIYQAHKIAFTPDSLPKIAFDHFEAAHWQQDNAELLLHNCHLLPPSLLPVYNQHYLLISISDSSLVLKEYSATNPLYSFYRKIPAIKETQDTTKTISYLRDPFYGKRFYLVNSADTSKKIELFNTESMDLYLAENTATGIQEHSYSGFIRNSFNGRLFFETYSEKTSTIPGTAIRANSETSISYSGQIIPQKEIPVDSIQSLNYLSPSSGQLNSFSIVLISLSSIELLVAAPLASIQYGKGGFNSKRYFRMAGIGLVGLGIGIPLAACNLGKHYLLTQGGKYSGKKYWNLEVR